MFEKDIVYSNPVRIGVNEFELTKTCIIVVDTRSLEVNKLLLDEIDKIAIMIEGL